MQLFWFDSAFNARRIFAHQTNNFLVIFDRIHEMLSCANLDPSAAAFPVRYIRRSGCWRMRIPINSRR